MIHEAKPPILLSSKNRVSFARYFRSNYWLYLFLLPALLTVIVFSYLPYEGLRLAFVKYDLVKGLSGSRFIGLDNFTYALSNRDFLRVMRNTLAISGIGFTFGFPLPILFAIMLNEIPGIRFKKFVQTTSYLPHFISWVVIAGIMYQMLDKNTGIVNRFIKLFGGEPIYFFAEPSMFWGLSVAISIWKGLGWSSIIYLASIVSIDPGLYEAAAIDGAGRGKRMWHITLPGILPTVTMMLILQAGSIFSGAGITPGFDGVYNLSNATLSQYSDILDIWVFRMGIQRQRYDIATAMGLLFGVVNMALVLVANWIARHVGEGYSII